MWIKELPKNLYECKSSIDTLNFLYNEGYIYVMDNHLAAGWCWLHHLDPQKGYNFFHIDRHNDLLCNAPVDKYEFLRDTPRITLDEYTALEFKNNFLYKVFQWDNFIKQVNYLFPNWFEVCYFATEDKCANDNNPPQTKKLNITDNCSPFELYSNLSYWITGTENKKWIVNVDLDYFFDDDGMQIFSEQYIRKVAQEIHSSLSNIAILTIALSPECCGSWQKSIWVMNIFAEELHLELRIDVER